jgi:xanthine dehydrogenase YagS FAD-binding subunit
VSKPCNKRLPGSGCPAREGEHHGLAILGWSEACVATHPSDMAVALVALDATVELEGPDGVRSVPLEAFHRLPGDEPQRDTVLGAGELITAVELPELPFARRSLYLKARERASFSFALASVAAALDLRGVAHVPWRARRAEEALRGRPLDGASIAAAADAEIVQARPLRDNVYKVELVGRLLRRALLDLAEAA